MQRYFFDLKFDGEEPSHDEEGSLFANVTNAQLEAERALCDLSKEMIDSGRHPAVLIIIVRDDHGPVLETSLTFGMKRMN